MDSTTFNKAVLCARHSTDTVHVEQERVMLLLEAAVAHLYPKLPWLNWNQ